MLRDFFLGIVKIHILYHADLTPIYGKGLMQELGRHGYQIGAGTLYPILHGMEREKLLNSYKQLVEGRVRRYYRITRKGRGALAEARSKVRELVAEILA